MSARLQLRGDTLENWLKYDPVLMEREVALIASNSAKPKVYDLKKVGDGTSKFSELPMLGYECLQDEGDSQQFPISQKVTTKLITDRFISSFSQKGYVNASGIFNTQDKNFCFFIVRLNKDEQFYVKGAASSNASIYYIAFFDKEWNFLSNGSLINTSNKEDTINSYPSEATYVVVTMAVSSSTGITIKNGAQTAFIIPNEHIDKSDIAEIEYNEKSIAVNMLVKGNIGYVSNGNTLNTVDPFYKYYILVLDKNYDLECTNVCSKNKYVNYLVFADAEFNFLEEGSRTNDGVKTFTIKKEDFPSDAIYAFITCNSYDNVRIANGLYDHGIPNILDTSSKDTSTKILSVSSIKVSKAPGKNLFDKNSITKGYFINSAGNEQALESYFITDYIPLNGKKVVVNYIGMGGFCAAYDKDFNLIKASLVQQAENTTIDGTLSGYVYARFSTSLSIIDKFMVEYGETHSSYEEGNPINGYLTTIKNTIANKLDKSLGKNLFDKNNVTKGYFINSSGVPQSNSSYFISDYIPLNGKKIVSNYTGSGGCMAVYDKDFNLVAALGVMNENSIIDGTLDNYIYCKVSANLSIIDKLMLEYGETHSDIYEEYNPISPYTKSFQKAIVYPSGSSITKDSIVTSGDDTIRLYNLSVVKNNYSVEFYGLIDSSSITLDVGVFAGDVTINTSNISYGSTSVAHGLTLKNFLSVSIVVKKYGKGDVTICTNGGTFTINDVPMTSVMGGCYAKVTLGTINNASLAFHSDVYSKSTWLFGDSYMDIWPPYIYDKYTDIMYNGYGGYSAANAYNSFIQALNYGKPKRVIWAIGMNNWESSWDSHTDSYDDWVLYTTKVVEYCEGNSIELIFITAPSTPEHSNSKKTSYTKTTWSTHKIIDVNEAVVKDSDTNEWYEGMLASDSIHPTEYGAVSIARFIDSHLNELT